MSDVKSNGVLRLFGVERDEKWKEDRGRFCVMREAKSNGEKAGFCSGRVLPDKRRSETHALPGTSRQMSWLVRFVSDGTKHVKGLKIERGTMTGRPRIP